VVVAGLVALAALLVGLWLSQRIARVLLQIREHVERVGAGDFGHRLDLRAARELRELSGQMNQMAVDLKNRMDLRQSLELAMQVQQSLLPESSPKKAGLDIAGESRYCDATGGDYYDFLDVAHLSGESVLLAVGDVMGHGIAAALLMATARAALRATSAREGSLGALMSQVNQVLASDYDRHGRFMTMALVIIDPGDRSLRWASAGHDPPILYHPAEDRFDELSGGDLPLGLVEHMKYREFCHRGLAVGTVVVIGTDGIWEAQDPGGEMFGKERLRAVIRSNAHLAAAEIAQAVEKEIGAFVASGPAQDDITFVVVKLTEMPKEEAGQQG
jgi:sigma-B regulation protein RsbU (phosphoserine phosphatase)